MTMLITLLHWIVGALVLSGAHAFGTTVGRRLDGWLETFLQMLLLLAVAGAVGLVGYGATFGLTHLGGALLRLL